MWMIHREYVAKHILLMGTVGGYSVGGIYIRKCFVIHKQYRVHIV